MTDQTNQQIDDYSKIAQIVLQDAAPVATLGGPAASVGVALAAQAIPALAQIAKMIYAMFHLNHIASQAQTPPPSN